MTLPRSGAGSTPPSAPYSRGVHTWLPEWQGAILFHISSCFRGHTTPNHDVAECLVKLAGRGVIIPSSEKHPFTHSWSKTNWVFFYIKLQIGPYLEEVI